MNIGTTQDLTKLQCEFEIKLSDLINNGVPFETRVGEAIIKIDAKIELEIIYETNTVDSIQTQIDKQIILLYLDLVAILFRLRIITDLQQNNTTNIGRYNSLLKIISTKKIAII